MPVTTPTPPPQPERGAFDRRGAAAYLSISTRLLDNLLSAGVIPRLKEGRKTLVRRIDCDDYLRRKFEEAVQ